ncbi:Glu/Leu/Phe/Val dehydrogenase dimerization domain-containing protein [Pleomorphovibrio marinus]|uniref:Glu/Leu/Phe/Val dehydrogenase dimerization domain-containing protein n=1 Tax=Pleomorphovibrio marinus TaxID=2164132 RepID=UPI000E0BC44B|nr:Glu/Leu/Phe/Val dehydrogenase dimerization domain-containing protein [Pleomorphovibrio marinus]
MASIKAAEKTKELSIYGQISGLGHEQLVICYDEPTGLKAIIGIHNTVLGPGLGGTRMWPYSNEQDAIKDVLRLSRGMTFKAAISGLNIGGGKAVLIGDPKLKTEAYLRRLGRFIQSLGGRYVTAEDVNMNTRDMELIAMETPYVTGLPEIKGGGGDPSPVTAYGTYLGMKAAAKKAYGNDSLEGKRVVVQGVGQVGSYLVGHLMKEKAQVFVTDIFEEKLFEVAKKTGAQVIAPDAVYGFNMDIYSPCALGATLNEETIPLLKCDIVAGGANNQLEDEESHGQMLLDRGIVYAPDFLINAGGLINVYIEFLGGYKKEVALDRTEGIYATCLEVLQTSSKEQRTPQEIAMEMAWSRIESIAKIKRSYGS